MADDGHDAFVRCEFRANRTRIFGCTEVVTPDKLHFLTVDTTGVVDLFKLEADASLDVITVGSQIAGEG